MMTRSRTKAMELTVNIDFDEASRAWRENKNVLKNGCFSYKPEPRLASLKIKPAKKT